MNLKLSKIDAKMSINNSNEYSEESMITDLFRKFTAPVKAKRKEVEARIKALTIYFLLSLALLSS